MKQIIPNNMKAVLLKENGKLKVEQIKVPTPGPGEVLVKIEAAPINPSDLNFLKGSYGSQSVQTIPGLEGSGTVVKAGSGILPKLWLGKRVACAAPVGGTWAEYVTLPAATCSPLSKKVSLAQGSMSFVNPLTALAFFDIAKRGKHSAIVSTAAASALGKMILRLGMKEKIPIINIVRKKEQVDLLRSLGAEFVLQSSEKDFITQFQQLTTKLNSTLILDAVAGEFARDLLNHSPLGTTLLIYGFLGGEQITIDGMTLLNDNKTISAFWLRTWFKKNNFIKSLKTIRKVQQLLNSELATTIQKRLPLSSAQEAVEIYKNNMTAGKVLIIPGFK